MNLSALSANESDLDYVEPTNIVVIYDDARCRSSADITLESGDTVHLEGSCGHVRRQIRKYERQGLLIDKDY